MSPANTVEAGFAFIEGKHVQLPNLVLVPDGAKTFPVTIEWSIACEDSHVIGSHDPEDAHRWCVLDDDLKQVMVGDAPGPRRGSKKAEPVVARTLHGGGAVNPRLVTFEFTAAKLKHGAGYTLVASRHGLLATGGFVAVRAPKPRAVAKKKVARKRKTAAKPKKAKPKKRTSRTKAKPKAPRPARKKSVA